MDMGWRSGAREPLAVINESVDLIYNLTVLWNELEITAAEI